MLHFAFYRRVHCLAWTTGSLGSSIHSDYDQQLPFKLSLLTCFPATLFMTKVYRDGTWVALLGSSIGGAYFASGNSDDDGRMKGTQKKHDARPNY